MTTVSRPPRTGWWRFFLAAIAALLIGLLGAGTASATTPPEVETRVGASTPVTAHVVGVHESITAGQRWDKAPPQTVSMAGFGVAAKSVRFGPMNPGPLADGVASTFRSSSYTMTELSEATTLYRVYGGKAGQLGSYWTRVKPSGPLQAQLDSALNPAWGNSATSVATIRVPSGTTIYEGAAASQPIGGGGSILGGGSQVYIPRVDSSWLVP